MPNYTYKCSACGYEYDRMLKIDNRREPENDPCPECKECGTVKQLIGTPGFADPYRLGRIKPNEDFRQVLRNIRDGNPGSTIECE